MAWCRIEGNACCGIVSLKTSTFPIVLQVKCLVYSEGILLVGCADGGLRLIPVGDGTQFQGKPSLWPALNNKSSPGISSINVTYTTGKDGVMKCICCSGAEDGSVALFELKRVVKTSGFLM